VHLGIEAFRTYIAVKTKLTGVHEMLEVGWLANQPSHAFDDASTPVYYRALVIVIRSNIISSVLFTLPKILIIWHASQELLDTTAVFEACETQSSVIFLQHVVIICLHAIFLDPTLV
jgi:hypothetical protein